jgi:hypothetical protein
MAYIKIDASSNSAESQYTTGKVIVVKDHVEIPVFGMYDEKKSPVKIEFTRCGKYNVVVHTLCKCSSKDIAFCIPFDNSAVCGRWSNTDITAGSVSETVWCESTIDVLVRSKFSVDFEVWLDRYDDDTKDNDSEEVEFFIELHYRS